MYPDGPHWEFELQAILAWLTTTEQLALLVWPLEVAVTVAVCVPAWENVLEHVWFVPEQAPVHE